MQRPWVSSQAYGEALALLIQVRMERRVSQRELAKRLGKPRSFVTKIEARERRIDIVEFVAIARALGVQPGMLMTQIAELLPPKPDI
ncbi:MAG: helix-turn-helix domain-containing protein [Pseudomonadota bacterium]